MYSFINRNDIVIDTENLSKLKQFCRLYRKHIFDLLGSGFIKINYGLNAKGLHGYKYMAPCDKILEEMAKLKLKKKCSKFYEPVNWFMDYKSGFSFVPWKYSSLEKCQEIVGKKKGVDIKCPWELGRFYHLAGLAVLAAAEDGVREKIFWSSKTN